MMPSATVRIITMLVLLVVVYEETGPVTTGLVAVFYWWAERTQVWKHYATSCLEDNTNTLAEIFPPLTKDKNHAQPS